MSIRRCSCVGVLLAMGVLAGTLVRPAGAADGDAAPFGSPVADDGLYIHGLLDELEGWFGGGPDPDYRWDGQAWLGTDTDRLWLRSEGLLIQGHLRDSDQELLYDRPVSTFFDVQGGIRYDLDSGPGRGWAAVGVQGLAPYFFEVSSTLYASDGGHFAARVHLAYEVLITQRLILEPSAELNAYTRPDPARDVASGLSDLEAGVRIRYEIRRKLAPYLGVVYERIYGPAPGGVPGNGRAGDWRAAAGIRVWI